MKTRVKILASFAVLLAVFFSIPRIGYSAPNGSRKNLHYGAPPVRLEGKCDLDVMAGPPNWESIRDGDRPITIIILRLYSPVQVRGEKVKYSFNEAVADINEIQLATTNSKLRKKLLSIKKNQRIQVDGTLYHSWTSHQLLPLLMEITAIEQAR